MVAGMLMPRDRLRAIYEILFRDGVMVATNDERPQSRHAEVPGVTNLQVTKAMGSLKSRGLVRETFVWRHCYWYLTNEGIAYLRQYLHLPPEIVPASLQRVRRPVPPLGAPRRTPANVQSVRGPTSYVPKPQGDVERQEYRRREQTVIRRGQDGTHGSTAPHVVENSWQEETTNYMQGEHMEVKETSKVQKIFEQEPKQEKGEGQSKKQKANNQIDTEILEAVQASSIMAPLFESVKVDSMQEEKQKNDFQKVDHIDVQVTEAQVASNPEAVESQGQGSKRKNKKKKEREISEIPSPVTSAAPPITEAKADIQLEVKGQKEQKQVQEKTSEKQKKLNSVSNLEPQSEVKKEVPQSEVKMEEPKPKSEAKKEEPKSEAKKEEPKSEAKKEEPKSEAKKEEPKSEAKKEEPKSEAKKVEPKSEAKKEEPKPKSEAKKEEPKPKSEAKKEEPKPKSEAKKEEPKPKSEAKKEEPKPKSEAKKEEPKPKS
ncbi:hypothetical protein AB205_0221360, partial [Aquarana catesbeiana]